MLGGHKLQKEPFFYPQEASNLIKKKILHRVVSAITWCMETMEIFLGFLEGFLQEVISRLRFRGWRKIRKLGRERAFQEKEPHRDSMCKGAETQRTQHRSPYGERRCGLSSVTEGRK